MMINRQFTLSVAGLFLATSFLFGGIVFPTMLKIKNIRAGIAAEHNKIQERYDRRNQLKETLQNLQEIKGGIGALKAVAVQEGKELEFVQAIEDASSDTNTTQKLSLKTVNQTELSLWERSVPINIEVVGGFQDVLHYLKNIERLHYIVTIDSFTMKTMRQGTATGGAEVRTNLEGSVYWLTSDIPKFISQKTP